ncbi:MULTISPECIES: SDR family oxidoreductase [Kyrpidia]|uniref:NAD(P)-dependent dehydrogenase n=1 Tax=Kyrpidia spormannii TaxID=2055160 RepID=A0ACA8ZB29_9BACL|nr:MULTISPECIES: SDR family oxidoreductase [Kyrpidia]CAB3394047.1 putative NAD(P)-dependent dehydrogenase [Kyrpidia spormannii]
MELPVDAFYPRRVPPQTQPRQPGIESIMRPRPIFDNPHYRPSGKLQGKVCLITGGDSGIGRAVAVAFAKEGADVAIAYLDEHGDAEETRGYIQALGRRCLLLPGDIGSEEHCFHVVQSVVTAFGRLDVLVNNAGEQHVQPTLLQVTDAQMQRTFRTNIFAMFYLTKAALPYMKRGSAIVNTTSITAYEGFSTMIDYAATKAAVVGFTRSLALSLVPYGIRVNAVAPGEVWTPLIPSSFTPEMVASFGSHSPMDRPGQPADLAPAYVYLASGDSAFVTGQVIHVNGGVITGS